MPDDAWKINHDAFGDAMTALIMIKQFIVIHGNTYLYVDGREVQTYVQPGTILAITKASIETAVPLHRCPLRIPTVILDKDNCV